MSEEIENINESENENVEAVNDHVTEDEITKAISELTEEGYITGESAEDPDDDDEYFDIIKGGKKTIIKKDDDEDEDEDKGADTNAIVEETEEEEVDEEEEVVKGKKQGESRAERADVDSYEYEEGLIEGKHDKDVEEAEKKKAIKGVFKKAGNGYHRYVSKGGDRFDNKTYVKKGGKFWSHNRNGNFTTQRLEKAENVEQTIEVTPILKSFQESLTGIVETSDKKFQSTGTILKGLLEQIEKLSDKVDQISGTPNPRKSQTSPTYKDRFEKADTNSGLSSKTDKYRILDLMDTLTFQKGEVDSDMANAMTNFEQTSRLPENVALKIEKELGVKIYN